MDLKKFYESMKAAGLGATDAALMGFDDELSGAYGAAKDYLSEGRPIGESYEKYRDRYRDAKEQAREDSPISNFAGGAVPGLVGGSGITRGLLKAMGVGAGYGAMQGAGDAASLADVPREALEGIGQGAMFSGVMGAMGRGRKPPKTKDGAIDFLGARSATPRGHNEKVQAFDNMKGIWADQIYKDMAKTHPNGTTGGELRDYIMQHLGVDDEIAESIVRKIIEKQGG